MKTLWHLAGTDRLVTSWIGDALRYYLSPRDRYVLIEDNALSIFHKVGWGLTGLQQAAIFIRRIMNREVVSGDTLFVQNVFMPGLEAILDALGRYNLDVQVFGYGAEDRQVDDRLSGVFMPVSPYYPIDTVPSQVSLNIVGVPISMGSLVTEIKDEGEVVRQNVITSVLTPDDNFRTIGFLASVASDWLQKHSEWRWKVIRFNSSFEDVASVQAFDKARSTIPFEDNQVGNLKEYGLTLASSKIFFDVPRPQDFSINQSLVFAAAYGCHIIAKRTLPHLEIIEIGLDWAQSLYTEPEEVSRLLSYAVDSPKSFQHIATLCNEGLMRMAKAVVHGIDTPINVWQDGLKEG